MPKVILEFQLPDEREEFEATVKAMDYRLFAESIYDDIFRPILKYGHHVEEKKLDLNTVEYLMDRIRDKLKEDLS